LNLELTIDKTPNSALATFIGANEKSG